MLVWYFGIEYQFLGVIIQPLSCVFEFTAVESLAIDEFTDLCDELAGPFESRFFLPMWIKYVCCVCVRNVGIKPDIIDSQTMRRMSECTVRFGNCDRPFLSPVIYKSTLTKIITMSGSVFQASIHFRNAPTDNVHLPWIPLWFHWYMCCIVYRAKPQIRQRLVVAFPCRCWIIMLDRVLLIHFLMKCAMWTVFLSSARCNDVSLITSQYDMLVRFQLAQYWSSRSLDVSYAIDWLRLYCTETPQMDMLGSP